MDLPSTLGSPRQCKIAGEIYWVRPMTMDGLGILMAWLDDVLPGRADRKMPPNIGDDASQAAMSSFPGKALLAWLALREHGFSYVEAAAIVPHADDGDGDDAQRKVLDHFRLMEVFMSRRRTRTPSEGGDDVSQTWCEQEMARLAAEYGLVELGRLTLDQYEWLGNDGKIDEFGQFDLQAIQDDLPRRIAAIEAAKARGEMGVISSIP